MSTERIVADKAIAQDLAERIAERADAATVGDPRDPQTQIGPLINAAAMERVTGLVKDAVDKGATTLSGGQADGTCYPPTVITGVTPEMRVYGEESFGPLVTVVEVDGVEEAVAAANDTEYGLSAAVWSQNVPAALELAQRIESGICHINDTTVQDEPQMPFGGVKAIGLGPVRRPRGAGGVHRAALDHRPGAAAPVPDLSAVRRVRRRSETGAAPGARRRARASGRTSRRRRGAGARRGRRRPPDTGSARC